MIGGPIAIEGQRTVRGRAVRLLAWITRETTRVVGGGREAQHQPEREVGARMTEVTIREVGPSVLYAIRLDMGGSTVPRRKEGRAAFGVGRRAINFRGALNGGRQTRQVGTRQGQ